MNTELRMRRIWAVVGDIPPGRVASYGQIAGIAGVTRGARQVGYALKRVPDELAVPWHRVLRSSGRLAFEEGSSAFSRQVKLLAREGVPVAAGRVNMKKYRWQPDLDELLWKPSDSWDES
ncbi:MAG: methylated-DNA--[protein]-cysteine S-methyltransferase [Woeseia sp.]